ncbi:MAG TPA: phage holin family protein [Kofleriaceae bacterium]
MNQSPAANGDGATTRDLIRRISEDLRTITRNEIELLRGEARRVARSAAADGAVVVFGGTVALIGLAILCLAAVAALAPVLPSLALRLVVMGVVYLGIGGSLAATFALRLRRNAVPDIAIPVREVRATLKGAKATIEERGRQLHA